MNLNLCLDAVPNFLRFFDTSIAPPLLFYAYIPIFILSIFFGWFIFKNDHSSILGKYFLGITLSFAIWIFLILFQWTGVYLETVHLAWQLLILPEVSIFLFSVLFTFSFIFKKDVPSWCKYFLIFAFLFISIILPTQLNINSFDITNCEGVIGQIWPFLYVFELVNIIVILLIAIERLVAKIERVEKIKALLVSTGMVIFLSIFWLSNYFAELTKTYEINLIGPIGMILFLSLLTYAIVHFQAFNMKLLGAQALIVSLCFLVMGILFIRRIEDVHLISLLTLLLVIVLGYSLVRGVKKEVKQREELAKLNTNLQDLLKQRESLVHLVTHKVKGSFTRSKYIFAGILDGTFGEASEEVKRRAAQGLESDDTGIQTVDLVLNAANLQKGAVKYEMKPIDFKELILKTVAEKKVQAEARGLQMESNINDGKENKYNVLGDVFWLKEAINNLIENSIKYTKVGKITIGLEDGNGKVKLSVKDTGIGITDEDKKNLFTEGGRGKDSVKTNVDSTGYGLYSVKLIIEAHKGRVWVESEVGKGSTFYVELDAA